MKKIVKILPFFLLLIPINVFPQKRAESYSTSSVLSSGEWFKIAVTKDGIYRIDYSKLKQLGVVNPSNPRIFGNNFGQLSYYNDDPKPDDLKEIAIFTSNGNDGIFNEGDYLLFYGQGIQRWIYNDIKKEYDYVRHNYSDTAFYFLTSGSTSGKKIKTEDEIQQAENYLSSESDLLYIHEQENENLIKSGREWFQPVPGSGIRINPGFSNILTSEMITIDIRVVARASASTIFRLYENELSKKSVQVQGINLYNYTGTYAQINDSSFLILPGSSAPEYELKFFNNGESAAKGWLDFVKLQARKSNSFTGGSTKYYDKRSVAPDRITRFSIKTLINNVNIWDISDPFNTKSIQYSRNGDIITFKTKTDTLSTFIAFSENEALIPIFKQSIISNQDLHASSPADMIIVTHPKFKLHAEKLANIHFQNSGLVSQVVTLEQIYNEFSGGIPDIAAIRNFLRMKYLKQKGSANPLKYLLLFGDGSFENKSLPPHNPNFIPTYQSQNSNVIVSSFTSDDFYGLLDDGEGEADGSEDIGIGRLPVSDTSQAGIILNKIVRYLNPANMGDWENIICITADDEDGNSHMSDAEGLAKTLNDSVPSFNIDKIYLDAFKQVTTISGQSYPDVTKAINDRINSGCLIFNYVGHGNENGLTAERVLKTEDINSWNNRNKLPLFITATCEFSRFDDVDINITTREMIEKASAGELVLFNPNGGGIALMSTTRVVYSAPNYFLNKNIFNYAFDLDESGNSLRLGDIIRLAKNNSGSGPNKRNFTLLGDPAIRLAYPHYGNIITDSINNLSVSSVTDSIKALSLVTISGHIEDREGKLINDFNGIVSPIVYDKASKIKTLANDGGQIMQFSLRNNILFSGKTIAKDGTFRFTFIVPRDIDYAFGNGKISYYATDFTKDMNGSYSDIVVGGFSNITQNDNIGPEIKLFMNDTLFRSGGITDNRPRLLAIIEDEGGINTTGSGIGHDITAYLDYDPNRSFSLNNYFISDFDNYKRGRVSYDISELSAGSHTLTLKAWDNFNNSAEESILFLVEEDGKFILKNLLNYPNPFFNSTRISAEHNRPNDEFTITINIYNLNGKIIKSIQTSLSSGGYTIPPVIWDGNDDGGQRVGKGIYPYTINVLTDHGESTRASGRMIIL